jgi:hypothetical protein
LLGQEERRKLTEKEMKREICTNMNKYKNKSRKGHKLGQEKNKHRRKYKG